jgi:hypothetical protein
MSLIVHFLYLARKRLKLSRIFFNQRNINSIMRPIRFLVALQHGGKIM